MTIDWKRLLTAEDGYELRPGASAGEVAAAEAALKAALPAELNDIYRASNGVFDVTGQWFVIWPLADTLAEFWSGWVAGTLPAH